MTTRLIVRKSGGSTIVSLPKVVLETLHLQVGSVIHLSLENNKIVLTPANDEQTLENLLCHCPKKRFVLTQEDCEWVRTKSKGKEF